MDKKLKIEKDSNIIRIMKRGTDMKTLIVMDMQEISVGENHAKMFDYKKDLLERVNKVIDTFDNKHVVYIRNVMKDNFINKFAPVKAFEGTKEVELVEGLHVVNENILDKYTGDAFSNDKLDILLKELDTDEIELVGLDGGACVSLTAMGAVKHGYKVIMNTNAIGTMFDKKEIKYRIQLEKEGVVYL